MAHRTFPPHTILLAIPIECHPWSAVETVHPAGGTFYLLTAYGMTERGAIEAWYKEARRVRCTQRYPEES